MIEGIFRCFLQSYPARYREFFGPSMRDTFESSLKERRDSGKWRVAWFAIREACGMLNGVGREWCAQWRQGKHYLAIEPSFVLTANRSEMEGQLKALVRGMEHAIAHHDFAAARRYATEERITRAHLAKLCEGTPQFAEG